MQQSGRFKFLTARRRSCRRSWQRGQAYAEYLLITAVVLVSVIGIIWGNANDPASVSLVSSLKSFFNAYSFTLSLP